MRSSPASACRTRGGDAATKRRITYDVLAGQPGRPRDAVLLNAGCGSLLLPARSCPCPRVSMWRAPPSTPAGRGRSRSRLIAATKRLACEDLARIPARDGKIRVERAFLPKAILPDVYSDAGQRKAGVRQAELEEMSLPPSGPRSQGSFAPPGSPSSPR